MRIGRRETLKVLAGAALGATARGPARADYDPHDDIRLIVGFPAGGPLDIFARLVAPVIAERIGAAVRVLNHVGDSGNDATREVIRAPADGRTLLLCGPVNAINATLFPALDFDFVRDTSAVSPIATVPLIVETRPGLPFGSIADLVAFARAAGEPLRVAYAGKGTPQHIAIELFQMKAGVRFELRAHAGSAQALSDLLDGRADLMFDPAPSSMPHVHAGRLKALAITGAERSPLFPDLPTVAETIPGYEAGSWFGLVAPKGTADAVILPIHGAIAAVQRDRGFQERLRGLGATPLVGSPADFARFIAAETARYGAVARSLSTR